jgi:hypothetical protein
MRPYLEKSLHKNRAGGVTQGEGRVQAPVPQKKKKKKNPTTSFYSKYYWLLLFEGLYE